MRSEPARNVIGLYGTTLYYMVERPLIDGRPEFEIRAATPEDGPSRVLARIPASRVPSWQIVNPVALTRRTMAGAAAHRWLHHQHLGALDRERRVAPGDGFRRPRRSSSRAACRGRPTAASILAAIGEGDADIVLLDGLIDRR